MDKPTYDTFVYELNKEIGQLPKSKKVMVGSIIHVDDRSIPYKVVNVTIEGRRQIVDVVRG